MVAMVRNVMVVTEIMTVVRIVVGIISAVNGRAQSHGSDRQV